MGTAFAHRVSLSLPVFSVKVVRHRNWESFCGRLWKKTRSGGQPSLTWKSGALSAASALLLMTGFSSVGEFAGACGGRRPQGLKPAFISVRRNAALEGPLFHGEVGGSAR